MKLYVKYMVSIRCWRIAKNALIQLGYPYSVRSKGIINLPKDLESADRKALDVILRASGMVLLDQKRSQIVDKIDQVMNASLQLAIPIKSEEIHNLLEKEVGEEYNVLSRLISEVKGVSIAHYHLIKKVELAKEFLIYESSSLTEIALRLGFGSLNKMSYQFEKITGLKPIYYKLIGEKRFKESQIPAAAKTPTTSNSLPKKTSK